MLVQHRLGPFARGPWQRRLGANPELLRRRQASGDLGLPHAYDTVIQCTRRSTAAFHSSRLPRSALEIFRVLFRTVALPLVASLHRFSRSFSTPSTPMGASKIDGTAIAKRIREGLGNEVLERQKTNPR